MGVLLLALLARALVPAGFMVAHSDTLTLNITICAETSGELKHAQMVVPVERKAPPGEHPRHDATCAFSDLSKAALGGADPILLALALAFILLLAFAPPVAKPFAHAHYLRPPLRGPPVAI
ncbi:DUF2946 family protein [Leptolyngbya sp. 15MV]|nr:DUF2946 family protein [Leptolyngbya sp. 15MV]